MTPERTPEQVGQLVRQVVAETPVLDMHTHLYAPAFGPLLLWGIDELLTYHYLVAEVFRVAPMPYERFWSLRRGEQADYIWRHLFVERSPVSEATRGVVTALSALGLDPHARDLSAIRAYFAEQRLEQHVDRVLRLANVRAVVMTNDPFDDAEREVWLAGVRGDPRFQTALRLDRLLNEWEAAVPRLTAWGYQTVGDLRPADVRAVRQFLIEWIERTRPRYLAVSLPPTFPYPCAGPRGRLLRDSVLPAAREAGLPLALMIGVRRAVNPNLRLAGDGLGQADVTAVERLCLEFPDNRFLVTLLAREDQHALCVAARKLPNLLVFGCWWFLNTPSLIAEITRQRLELLGLSFVPQHSDARVLEQLLYKWAHSREVIADVLADHYAALARAGRTASEAELRRDVTALFSGLFEQFCTAA